MTCVLPTTPWHHFDNHSPWLSMTSDMASSHGALDSKSSSHRYVSPGSDTRKSSTSSTKKRASRAGTRSVTTLSAAQLERKRANDREAQRAIRQRTKDHIDHLERTVNDLRGSQEQSEKMVHATQQRNRELEEEVVFLRNKLNEAGFSMSTASTDGQAGLLSVPTASPTNPAGASIPRPGSTSTPSNHSVATQGSGSRHGSWQHGGGFVGTAMTLPNAPAAANPPGLTAWRSHESAQNLQPIQTSGSSLQDSMQASASATYQQGERVDWSGTPASYQYVSQEQQQTQQYETASAQQSQGYPSSTYPQLGQQSDFPNISVSSSPSYQVQGQASFPQQPSFQVASMAIPSSVSDYTSPHAQIQPPPLPNPSFHTTAGEHTYGQQPAPPAMQYRDESATRPYSLTHYPTA